MRAALACVLLFLLAAAPAAARSGPVQLGTAVNDGGFDSGEAPYRAALARHESLTPESAMKIDELQPARGRYEWSRADRIVAWAGERGLRVHGHTLAWCADEWLPGWLRNGTWTRESLLAVMRDHITTVMTRYRGQVASWDVVNEAFTAQGGARECLWSRVIGPDWVELAFRAARAADPGARLYYNEYAAEPATGRRFGAVEAMARDFVARGVPLDGIGLQYHLGGAAPLQFLAEDAMRRIGALGLAVHVSELDVTTSPFPGTTGERLDAQAQAYQTVAAACARVEACERITTWGVADHWSWRGAGEMALALDSSYGEKPAWTAMREVLRPAPGPALGRAPTAPGVPAASVAPNAGTFTVGWAPAVDQDGDRVSYLLEHRDADDAEWSPVATGMRGTGFAFGSGRLERQGTYRYRVQASDGTRAGAFAESREVVVDRTDPLPPAVVPDRGPEGAGWYRDSVRVAFADMGDPALGDGSDGAGVAPDGLPAALTLSSTGEHTVSGIATDRAGNRSRPVSATLRVDAAAPEASLTCPASPIRQGEAAEATWTGSDTGAGLEGPASGSEPLDTTLPGTFTARHEARDLVGHAIVAACEYDVQAAEPPPSPEPSATPTATSTPAPASSPSPTPTSSPAPTPTSSPAPTPTSSPSPTPTSSPTPTPTSSPAPTPTTTSTPTPTSSPAPTPTTTSTPTPTPASSPAPTPATTSTPAPTSSPAPPSSPSPTTSPTPTSSPAPSPAAAETALSLEVPGRVKGGRVRIALACSAGPCSGRLALAVDPRARSAPARRLRRLGGRSFSVPAGESVLTLRLSRRERAALARLRRLPVVATVELAGAEPVKRRLTLRAAKPLATARR